MCTGRCSRCIATCLYPLAFISALCNIILFFPGWSTEAYMSGEIIEEVKYMGGLIGGGLMVLSPTLFIHMTGQQGCCGNRCGVIFSVIGVAGAIYSLAVAVLGLLIGLKCKGFNTPGWVTDKKLTDVDFNMRLFSTLVVTSGLQIILCLCQMINGLDGCLCGTCNSNRPQPGVGMVASSVAVGVTVTSRI